MKQAFLLSIALITISLFFSSAVYARGMQDDVNRAAAILESFQNIPEESIPKEVLMNAKGLAILSVVKAGFIVSGRGGVGVVMARTPGGWSGPSAIGAGGAGFGFQIGGSVTDFVIVLNSDEALYAFYGQGNVELGAGLSVAAGPVGRTVEAGVMPMAAVYSYSRSKGFFAGVSLEGTVITARDKANYSYYGRMVTPGQILSGMVEPPPGARKLERLLEGY